MQSSIKSIQIKPGKEKAILNRHPWLFSGAVKKISQSIEIGDVVAVKDQRGEVLAYGHWCSDEGLVCRLFSIGRDDAIDETFWLTRMRDARALRTMLGFPSASTNGYRLIHGEGDGFSGLVVDIYHDSASISSMNPGLDAIMPTLTKFLVEECAQKRVFYDAAYKNESRWLVGHAEASEFVENNLRFLVDISEGQKTGHFLDQRDNRCLVQSFAHERDVLDAFSYSGGFSVYAGRGQARSVTSLDISKPALSLAEANMAQNNLASVHRTVAADCFTFLRTLTSDEYDLIILDPPAFAKSAHAVMRASRGYKDINLVAMKAIRRGGLLFTFSCSQHIDQDLFKKIIFAAAKDAAREVRILKELSQGADHPVSVFCPQSHYLKGLLLQVA